MSTQGSVRGSEQGSATVIEPKEKRKVYIQVNFIKIGEVNTVKESFDAEVMIKSRWREPALDGKEGGAVEGNQSLEKQWNPQIYIENTVGDPQIKTVLETEQIKDETFVVERKKFRGSFVELMELWDFPFDVQLSLLIKSEKSINDTQLVDEPQEMHKIHKRSFMDEQEFYLYKYIQSSIPPLSVDQQLGIVKQKKPSIKVTIFAGRLPHYYIWNMFLLMNVIIILSFTSFGIAVQFVPNRLQLCFVLVLTAVTFKNLVNAQIPKISYFTYLDVYVLTMTIVLASISCWHGLMTRVPEKIKVFVDHMGLLGIAIFYLLFHVIFISVVLAKPYSKRRQMQVNEKAYEGKYSEALKARTQVPQPKKSKSAV